ncbi:MAG: InlB B-repeat-containing protein [Oscillibacter sp.]|nr:InlB B-repeat-containing protein [Oscillibacter sp.]
MTWCMLLSLIVIPGGADDKLSAWVDNDLRVMPGNTIDLNMNIAGNPGLKVLSLRVYYESDKLECIAIDDEGTKEGTDKVPNIWYAFLETTTRKDKVFNDSNPNDTSNNKRDASKWSLASFTYTIDAANPWTTSGVLAKMTFKPREGVTSPVDATIDTEIVAATDIQDKRLESGDMQGISAVLHIGEAVKNPVVTFDGNGATSGSMNPQTFQPDTEQKLTKNAFVKTGYKFVGWSETKDGEVTYTDEQPVKIAAAITLYAKWEPVYKIEVVQTTGGTVEANKTTAKTGDEVELTVTPDTNNGYVLKDLKVTDKDGKIEPTRSSDMTAAASVYKFTVRTSDVKAEATFIKYDPKPKPVKTLPAVPEEGGKVESDKTEAVTGEEVTVTVTPDTNKGYVLKKLTVTGSDKKDVACQRKETESTNYAFSEYVFKMTELPSDGFVTVQAEFGIPRLVILPETVEHGSVTSDKQPSAYVGETVTLTVEPETGYQLKEDFPKVTKADGTPIMPKKVDEKTYTFVMENSDATVSVEFKPFVEEITVTYKPGEGSGENQTKKERLPFNLPGNPGFTSPAGKSLDGWTLPDNQFYAVGTEITALADNSELTAHYSEATTPACYVATAVYGSYDCPEVWTLRRFRDHVLAKTWYGRLFIKLYYAVSPTAVRLFGDTAWFRNFWRGKLDSMVASLQADGFESTPYQDMDW